VPRLVINGSGDEREILPEFKMASKSFEQPSRLNSAGWFEETRRRQEVRRGVEDKYDYAEIEVQSDRPVIVGVTGDWHLGAEINLDMLYRDVDIIANHPLVTGAFFMGDLTDSANFNPAQDEDVLSYEEQRQFMMSILTQIGKDRILGMWKGNHDHKWESKGGVSKYAELSQRYGVPVFYGPAFIKFKVNDIEYRLMGSHRLRGDSIYTNAHPAMRGHREVQGLDISMCGHTHKRGVIQQAVREFDSSRPVVALVSGTYEYGTGYTKDSGFGQMNNPEMGMWWLVLGHDKKMVRIMGTDEMLQLVSEWMVDF